MNYLGKELFPVVNRSFCCPRSHVLLAIDGPLGGRMRHQLGSNIDLLPRAALGSGPEGRRWAGEIRFEPKRAQETGAVTGLPRPSIAPSVNRIGGSAARRCRQKRQMGRNSSVPLQECHAWSARNARGPALPSARRGNRHLDGVARRFLELQWGASSPTRAARSAGRCKRPAICRAAMRDWWSASRQMHPIG